MVCNKCGFDFSCEDEAAKLIAAKTVWRCDACASDAVCVNSHSDTEELSIVELPKNIQLEMGRSSKANSENFAVLKKTMESIENSLGEVKARLVSLEQENNILKCECNRLKENNLCLESQIRIPVTKNEDVYTILASIARAIGLDFLRDGISIAHRLPPPKDRRFSPNIIVQFLSRSMRNKWLFAAKKRRLHSTDLASSLSPAPLYTNEHLITLYKKPQAPRIRQVSGQGWEAAGCMLQGWQDHCAEVVWCPRDVDRIMGDVSQDMDCPRTEK
ncbi:hypothetical protein J6590_047793 [Homalodisca vitripennis]|nr:hypothetical protein J6590_047793 [Homalodisca vitripennis]